MKISLAEPDILQFNDYRLYLKTVYELRKNNLKKYSYRQFSQDLGFKATNHMHLVVMGKRNLSTDAIELILTHANGSAQYKKYFKNLICFNQSQTDTEKKKYKNELDKILGKDRKQLNPDQYTYFSNWYIPVIREVLALKGFVSNLNWISKKLRPTIDESLIKNALMVLERLGMIKRVQGKWLQSSQHLTTDDEITSDMISNYHKDMLRLSANALNHSSKSRDISAMTMSLSTRQFDWLKQRIVDFRNEIRQELQETTEDPTIVGQLNIQLFLTTEKQP